MKEWILKNWGNVFSALGLIAAIYIGVFYVPSYVQEAITEKQNTIHNDLIQATKELVYSDSVATANEINTLIKGKEIKYGIEYAYSTKQLLLQTQESFMEHKFLPLIKRKELIAEIDEIKAKIKDDETKADTNQNKSKSKFTLLFQILSISISLLAVIAGLISTIFKYRQEKAKSEEISNQIETHKQEIKSNIQESAYNFENSIVKIINDKLNVIGNQPKEKEDRAIDYKFVYNEMKNYVFVKYLSKSKVGLSSVQAFLNSLVGRKGNAIIVYNTDLTTMVSKEIEKFRERNPELNIVLIKAVNRNDFENKFNAELLNKKAKA